MIIAIDFDGTCVTHEYPNIGKDIGAVSVLQKIVKDGHQLILNTMRSGIKLQEAVDWFKKNDIPLYGINKNPDQKLWTASPKVYADLYIDDAALGCPLKYDVALSSRMFVDWVWVARMIEVESELPEAATNNLTMTVKQYAAIHLKVPRSGNAEIDAMIRESVRRDFAEKALAKLVFPIGSISVHIFGASARESDERDLRAYQCFRFADAMLAEWEKEAGK
jgi:hypothetical protein